MFVNAFMSAVGWVTCGFIVGCFLYVVVAAIQTSVKKSERYKRKERARGRKLERRRVEEMFVRGIISHVEARTRLDALNRQEKADV